MTFGIDGFFSRYFRLRDDGYFTIFDTHISDAVKIGFRIHDAAVKDDHVKFLIGSGPFSDAVSLQLLKRSAVIKSVKSDFFILWL